MLFWIIVLIMDIFAIFSLLFNVKNGRFTTYWILTVLLLPFLGALLYFFTGNPRHFITSPYFSYKTINNGEYQKAVKKDIARVENTKLPYKDLILYNLKEADSLYQTALTIDTFTSGKQKYTALCHDIMNAKHHIHVLYYIFENDKVGAEIAKLLAKKAKEGVEVKVLYDPWGNHTKVREMFAAITSAGGEVIAYAPLFSKHFGRLNYRNHRKIVVIDGIIGYTGGMNISNNYANLGKIRPWRDTQVRITGEAVQSLQLRFFMDWAYSGDKAYVYDEAYYPKIQQTGNIPIQIVAAGPDKNQEPIKNGYIKIIDSAKETIYMQSGYFVPDKPLYDVIKHSAEKGVDVRMILPGISDHYPIYAAAATYLADLIRAGVKIYYYKGYIHAKSMVADGEIADIGTANLDIRSFHDNLELTAIIYDHEFAQKQVEIFLEDLNNSEQIFLNDIVNRSIKDKVVGYFMRIFTRLL